MERWLPFAALGLTLALSAPAAAATFVSFEEGKGRHSDVRYDGDHDAIGTWSESGFDVSWRSWVGSDGLDGALSDFTFLADTISGLRSLGTSLEFSRADGATFDLASVDVAGTWSSWRGWIDFIGFDENGQWDYDSYGSIGFDVIYDNIGFRGVRADGTSVSVSASSLMGDLERTTLAGESIAALSDLTSLTVGLIDPASYEELLEDSVARAALGGVYAQMPASCPGFCDVPGVGHFEVYASPSHGPNWGTAVRFGDFAFDVTPAAVPLPASVWALAAGLGALGFAGARRRGWPSSRP